MPDFMSLSPESLVILAVSTALTWGWNKLNQAWTARKDRELAERMRDDLLEGAGTADRIVKRVDEFIAKQKAIEAKSLGARIKRLTKQPTERNGTNH